MKGLAKQANKKPLTTTLPFYYTLYIIQMSENE